MSIDLAALFPLDRTLPEPRETWSAAELAPVLADLQERTLLVKGAPSASWPLSAHCWAVASGGCLLGWGTRRGTTTKIIALLGVAPSPDAARKGAEEITAWCEARQ